jgi:hypothetical protein
MSGIRTLAERSTRVAFRFQPYKLSFRQSGAARDALFHSSAVSGRSAFSMAAILSSRIAGFLVQHSQTV